MMPNKFWTLYSTSNCNIIFNISWGVWSVCIFLRL